MQRTADKWVTNTRRCRPQGPGRSRTGMTWRALRIACHLIGHPAQWSEEHGYSAIRGLFEAIVQIRWMLAVEETRPTVWPEFKDYGRRRTKATLRLLDNHPSLHRSFAHE